MFSILLKQFFRAKTTLLALVTLLVIGIISIGLGNHFIKQQQEVLVNIETNQAQQHQLNIDHYADDIAYAAYYMRFAYINPLHPITGLSIGQRDVNTNLLNIGIVTLEGQKYDTDLVNPVKQQAGNLDLSFVIIFIFPLVIIALSFNILSEEKERGIWKLIRVQGKSLACFLLSKLSVRIIFVVSVLVALFVIAMLWSGIALDDNYLSFIGASILYLLFWFTLSLLVVSLQKNSNTNAIVLITIWLLQVAVLPMIINNYTSHKYPIGEGLGLLIQQRDKYHQKWDTDKKETLDKFYKHYPQFAHYGNPEEGFTWSWYYAMQQMGDDESAPQRAALFQKIEHRKALIEKLSFLCPPLRTQLAMNKITNSGLDNYLNFLEGTTLFHEKIRLSLYDPIFQKKGCDAIDWSVYKPEYHKDTTDKNVMWTLLTLLFFVFLCGTIGVFNIKRL